MIRPLSASFLVLLLLTPGALPAQPGEPSEREAGHGAHPASEVPGESPYAGHTGREIKALSAQETEQLLAGEGMGLALPAELNGYPGPKHVLELADELELSRKQRASVTEAYDAMHGQAVELGRQVLEAERRLDALFARAEATPDALRAALEELAALRADLRYAHLAAHLETRELLTEDQRRRYDHLRGYSGHERGHGRGHEPGHDPADHGHPHGRR